MAEKTFAEILDDVTEQSRMMDAPLGERLKAVAEEVARLSPEFAAIVERMIARLEASSVGQSAPRPGELMPELLRLAASEGGALSGDQHAWVAGLPDGPPWLP